MKRGISPIVAVVLLIAIAVIAAVGLYFWVGSLTGKQATPNTPNMITANPISDGKIIIANLGKTAINTSELRTDENSIDINCNETNLKPGEQIICTIKGNATKNDIAIYGNESNVIIISGGNKVVDNPPTISDLTDNSTDGEILLGDTLRVQAKAGDDVGLKSVILHADNPSGDFEMQDVGNDIYVKDITPQVAGELNYFVTANDTSDQSAQSATHTVKVIQNWMNLYNLSYATSITTRDNNSGYMILGAAKKITLIQIDNKGNVEWAKEYDANESDIGIQLVKNNNGGYTILGIPSNPESKSSDIIVIGVDDKGNVEWAKGYGGNKISLGFSILSMNDDGYIVVGATNITNTGDNIVLGRSILLLKVDNEGKMEWAKEYTSNRTDNTNRINMGESITKTDDGGYIICGATNSFDDLPYPKVILIKVNKTGNVEWAKEYGPSNPSTKGIIGIPCIIRSGANNNYIIETQSISPTKSMIVVISVNNNGNVEWAKGYAIENKNTGVNLNALTSTNDDRYIIYGGVSDYSDSNGLIMRIDETGNVEWAKEYGSDSNQEEVISVLQTTDGGYLAVGRSLVGAPFSRTEKALAIKIDRYGNLRCMYQSNVSIHSIDYPLNVTLVKNLITYNATQIINETNIQPDMITKNVNVAKLEICQPFEPPYTGYGNETNGSSGWEPIVFNSSNMTIANATIIANMTSNNT